MEKLFYATQAKGDQFGKEFWLASKVVADREGADVIYDVVARGRTKNWKGEEWLIFLPLIALTKRSNTTAILGRLRRYKLTRDWAAEVQAEFEMPDTAAAVKYFSGRQTH